MRILKISLVTLLVAIATDMTIYFAAPADYPAPINTKTGIVEIPNNTGVWTRYLTKNTWTPQTYYHDFSSTWLTNPCPKCKIAAKPATENGDTFGGKVTVMGELETFNDPTSINYPNVYKLYLYRYDTTLLTTNHSGTWTING